MQKILEMNYYIIDCNNFYIKSSLKILIKTWLHFFWKIVIFLNFLVNFQPFFHRGLFIICRGPAHFQTFARISLVFVLISASVDTSFESPYTTLLESGLKLGVASQNGRLHCEKLFT